MKSTCLFDETDTTTREEESVYAASKVKKQPAILLAILSFHSTNILLELPECIARAARVISLTYGVVDLLITIDTFLISELKNSIAAQASFSFARCACSYMQVRRLRCVMKLI